MTTVISVRGRTPAELMADPNFFYVGRAMPRRGWRDSGWGNPFKPGLTWGQTGALLLDPRLSPVPLVERLPDLPGLETILNRGRATVVECHHDWLIRHPGLVVRLPELRDKVLGCWCGDWRPGLPQIGCHAVTLARLANRLES